MRLLKIVLLSLAVLGLLWSSALAAGDAAKGKALFNDPKAFGGTISCSTCHPGGKGLEGAAAKKAWSTPAGRTRTLEEAVNLCIVNANKGKAIDVKSGQMKDIVAYISSLPPKVK